MTGLKAVAGLKAAAVNLFLNSEPRVTGAAHRALATLVPGRRALEFYWSAACPYSYLMAQQLARITADSTLAIIVRPMPIGTAAVNPAPQLRERHGPRDCAALAEFYDVDFPSEWAIPSPEVIAGGNRVVASALSLEACIAVGRALWRNDATLLGELVATHGEASQAEAMETGQKNAARQKSAGHYQPGTICYLGEWFEGPMRVELVAERVKAAGHRTAAAWSPQLTATATQSSAPNFEMWFSFRSPYAYLAVAQIQRWREAGQSFELEFRPVLPMVMRGMAVPTAKKMYIVKDAAREARRLSIPFGRIADPVGAGAQRCLALCAQLNKSDGNTRRSFDFAASATTGIWSQGIDVASEDGLITVAERANISRDEVRAALANMPAGAALAESSRELMNEAGVWGVPCFRAGDFVTWGQDRLHLLRKQIGLPQL